MNKYNPSYNDRQTTSAAAKKALLEKARALAPSNRPDFAERQAEREVPMKMEDWAKHLDAILTSTGENLLLDAGKVSHRQAIEKATQEYRKYQAKTLSPVEEAYLDTIKTVQKKVEKKAKEKPARSKK